MSAINTPRDASFNSSLSQVCIWLFPWQVIVELASVYFFSENLGVVPKGEVEYFRLLSDWFRKKHRKMNETSNPVQSRYHHNRRRVARFV